MKRPYLHKLLKKIYLFKFAKFVYFNLNKLKILKKYYTSTGIYYLPFFAFKDGIKNSIVKDKIFDEHIFKIGKKYILTNSAVIDAGANYGQYSILFSECQKNVEVHSFEANKFVYEILNKNIKTNKAKIKSYNCLLGKIKKSTINIEKIKLKTADYGSQKFEVSNKSKSTEQIKAIRIDDINFKKKISFFKIDVEGMDYEVLLGAKKTILKHKMPIVFEYINQKSQYSFKDIKKFVKQINYYFAKKIDKSNYLIKSKV